jgi:hypothetical protein
MPSSGKILEGVSSEHAVRHMIVLRYRGVRKCVAIEKGFEMNDIKTSWVKWPKRCPRL